MTLLIPESLAYNRGHTPRGGGGFGVRAVTVKKNTR